MAKRASKRDRDEFRAYLRQCSDSQVFGVYTKEIVAGRRIYAQLAQAEAVRRGLENGDG